MQRQDAIRVLLVERDVSLAAGLRAALNRDFAFEVVGVTGSALEATRLARSHRPDLVVCDTALPEPGAVELARFFRVRMPGTSVVFLSRSPSEQELFEAVRVGVAAYLRAGSDPRALVGPLRRAANGEFLIDEEVMRHPAVASRILAQFRLNARPEESLPDRWATQASTLLDGGNDTLAPLFVPLSAREIEILDLVARGNSNKLIARRLGISDQTVKNHITTILRKLEVNDRTEAVVCALRNGWIRIDAPARG